jgi:hypothetical protein
MSKTEPAPEAFWERLIRDFKNDFYSCLNSKRPPYLRKGDVPVSTAKANASRIRKIPPKRMEMDLRVA